MQFRLFFRPKITLTLPLSYHHILSGFIYHMIRQYDPDYATFLHDIGYGPRGYKLFTISLIEGKSIINRQKKEISFPEQLSFEIRSPMREFCDAFYMGLMETEQYWLYKHAVDLLGCVTSKRKISDEKILIGMKSPLTVSRNGKEGEGIKTIYYSPHDPAFTEAVVNSSKDKCLAGIGMAPEKLAFQVLSYNDRNKYVTKFDNKDWITGWKGVYSLEGSTECLTFLYDAGLGTRTAQGFGMFELLEND